MVKKLSCWFHGLLILVRSGSYLIHLRNIVLVLDHMRDELRRRLGDVAVAHHICEHPEEGVPRLLHLVVPDVVVSSQPLQKKIPVETSFGLGLNKNS